MAPGQVRRTLPLLPAGLGGVGVESVAQRADATFYSSFLTAHFRVQKLGMGAMGAGFGPEHPTLTAIRASRGRLGATRGVDDLLQWISLQDNPLQVQGKLMSLVHADVHRVLARSLPDRQSVTLHHQSMNPHWVSISASADPNLQLSDESLASALAQRLSLTQKPIPRGRQGTHVWAYSSLIIRKRGVKKK